jgi:hypothetical protein
VKFTQTHATTMADVDGDGVLDLITGKRYWAHGPNKDAEPGSLPFCTGSRSNATAKAALT